MLALVPETLTEEDMECIGDGLIALGKFFKKCKHKKDSDWELKVSSQCSYYNKFIYGNVTEQHGAKRKLEAKEKAIKDETWVPESKK